MFHVRIRRADQQKGALVLTSSAGKCVRSRFEGAHRLSFFGAHFRTLQRVLAARGEGSFGWMGISNRSFEEKGLRSLLASKLRYPHCGSTNDPLRVIAGGMQARGTWLWLELGQPRL